MSGLLACMSVQAVPEETRKGTLVMHVNAREPTLVLWNGGQHS